MGVQLPAGMQFLRAWWLLVAVLIACGGVGGAGPKAKKKKKNTKMAKGKEKKGKKNGSRGDRNDLNNVSSSTARSFNSCKALGLSVAPNSNVCASSRVSTIPTGNIYGWDCPLEVSWTEARLICAKAGMRLCTHSELMGDVAKGTGCNADFGR